MAITSVTSDDLFDTSSESSKKDKNDSIDNFFDEQSSISPIHDRPSASSHRTESAFSSNTSQIERMDSVPKVGMHVEACDKEGIWSMAEVVQLKKKKSKSRVQLVKISYDGWGSEWDEIMDFTDEKRIAKLGTHTLRFKCMVNLLNERVGKSHRSTDWPCVVNVRTPSSVATLAQYEFAEESLRIEQNIFIEPYGQEHLPEDVTAVLLNRGTWVNIENVLKWKVVRNPEKNKSNLAKNFMSAYHLALEEGLPSLPGGAFTSGTLIDEKLRRKPGVVMKKNKKLTKEMEGIEFHKSLESRENESLVYREQKNNSSKFDVKKIKSRTIPSENYEMIDDHHIHQKSKSVKKDEKKNKWVEKSSVVNSVYGQSRDEIRSMKRKRIHKEIRTDECLQMHHNNEKPNESQVPKKKKIRIESENSNDRAHESTNLVESISKTDSLTRREPSEKSLSSTDSTSIPKRKRQKSGEKTKNLLRLKLKIPSNATNKVPKIVTTEKTDDAFGNSRKNSDYLSMLVHRNVAEEDLPIEKKKPKSMRQQMVAMNPRIFKIPKKSSSKQLSNENSNHSLTPPNNAVPSVDIPAKNMNLSCEDDQKLRKMVRNLKERVSKRAMTHEVNQDKCIQHSKRKVSTKSLTGTSNVEKGKRRDTKSVSINPQKEIKCKETESSTFNPKVWLRARGPKLNCVGFKKHRIDGSSGLTLWRQKIRVIDSSKKLNDICSGKEAKNKNELTNQTIFHGGICESKRSRVISSGNLKKSDHASGDLSKDHNTNRCSLISTDTNNTQETYCTALDTSVQKGSNAYSDPLNGRVLCHERKTPDPIEESSVSKIVNHANETESNRFDQISTVLSQDSHMSISSTSSMSISIQSDESFDKPESTIPSKDTNAGQITSTISRSAESNAIVLNQLCSAKSKEADKNQNNFVERNKKNSKLERGKGRKENCPLLPNSGSHKPFRTKKARKESITQNVNTKKKMDSDSSPGCALCEAPSLSEESKSEMNVDAQILDEENSARVGVVNKQGQCVLDNAQGVTQESETVLMAVVRCRKMLNSGKPDTTCDQETEIVHSNLSNGPSNQKAAEKESTIIEDEVKPNQPNYTIEDEKLKQKLSFVKKQLQPPTMTHAEIFAHLKAKRREGRKRTIRKGVKKGRTSARVVSNY